MSYQYDFELTFVKDYDANVILNAEIPDKDEGFQAAVKGAVESIINVFNIYAGVHKMSSFIDYNGHKYKITLLRA